jgi:hypothetical protein
LDEVYWLAAGTRSAARGRISERINVLSTLENEYGFRHDDTDDGNIFDEKTKTERLDAIDLESHTLETNTMPKI